MNHLQKVIYVCMIGLTPVGTQGRACGLTNNSSRCEARSPSTCRG